MGASEYHHGSICPFGCVCSRPVCTCVSNREHMTGGGIRCNDLAASFHTLVTPGLDACAFRIADLLSSWKVSVSLVPVSALTSTLSTLPKTNTAAPCLPIGARVFHPFTDVPPSTCPPAASPLWKHMSSKRREVGPYPWPFPHLRCLRWPA